MGIQDSSINQHVAMQQQQQCLFAARIRTIAGNLTSNQLRKLAGFHENFAANAVVHASPQPP